MTVDSRDYDGPALARATWAGGMRSLAPSPRRTVWRVRGDWVSRPMCATKRRDIKDRPSSTASLGFSREGHVPGHCVLLVTLHAEPLLWIEVAVRVRGAANARVAQLTVLMVPAALANAEIFSTL